MAPGASRAVWQPHFHASAKKYAKQWGGKVVALTVKPKPAPITLPPEQFDALLSGDDNDCTLCTICGEFTVEEDYDYLHTCAACVAKEPKDALKAGRYVLDLPMKERQCVEWDIVLGDVCDELEETRKQLESERRLIVRMVEDHFMEKRA